MVLELCYAEGKIVCDDRTEAVFENERTMGRFCSVEFNTDGNETEVKDRITSILSELFYNKKYFLAKNEDAYIEDAINSIEVSIDNQEPVRHFDSLIGGFKWGENVEYIKVANTSGKNETSADGEDKNKEKATEYVLNLGAVDFRRALILLIDWASELINKITITECCGLNGPYKWEYTNISHHKNMAIIKRTDEVSKKMGKEYCFYANVKVTRGGDCKAASENASENALDTASDTASDTSLEDASGDPFLGVTPQLSGYGSFVKDYPRRSRKTELITNDIIGFRMLDFESDKASKVQISMACMRWAMFDNVVNKLSIPIFVGNIRINEHECWQGIFSYLMDGYDAIDYTWNEDIQKYVGLYAKYAIKLCDGRVTSIVIGNIRSNLFFRKVGIDFINQYMRENSIDYGPIDFGYHTIILEKKDDKWVNICKRGVSYISCFFALDCEDNLPVYLSDDEFSQIIIKDGAVLTKMIAEKFYSKFEDELVRKILFQNQFYYAVSGKLGIGCRLKDNRFIVFDYQKIDDIPQELSDGIKEMYYQTEINRATVVRAAYNDFGRLLERKSGLFVIEIEEGTIKIGNMDNLEISMISFTDKDGVEHRTKLLELVDNIKLSKDTVVYATVIKNFIQYISKNRETNHVGESLCYCVVCQMYSDRTITVLAKGLANELSKVPPRVEVNGYDATYEFIKNTIYPPESGFIADTAVVNMIYDEWEKFKDTGVIPNLVIMGEAGTGKSKITKNIASLFIKTPIDGKPVLVYKSGSDLKGAYLGQTSARVYDLIKETAEMNRDEMSHIIFIDEAYHLQDDKFGKEAVDMLLPLMSGDRKIIEKPAMDREKAESYEFDGTFVPPIWLAGYEQPMREMLSDNPGLYRRVIKVVLETPSVNDIFAALIRFAGINYEADKKKSEEKTGKAEAIDFAKIFEDNRKTIKKYFAWAILPDYSEYFANYAGMESFYADCRVRIRRCVDGNYDTCIEEVIKASKAEIKRQYKANLFKGQDEREKIQFEIETDIEMTFDEIRGVQINGEELPAKQGLRDILTMLFNRKLYLRQGIAVPKGVLLVGPPGTGKTMYARALAGEMQMHYTNNSEISPKICFIPVSATELDTSKKIKALFRTAENYDECIIFIDEIDAIACNRSIPGARKDLLISLMTELDGFAQNENLFILAATNDPGNLDPAIKRPGRFDRIIEINHMDAAGRKDLIKFYMQRLGNDIIFSNQPGNFSLDEIAAIVAKRTAGYSGARLRNIINEAAILNRKCFISDENASCQIHRTYKGRYSENHKNMSFFEDILEIIEREEVGEVNLGKREAEFRIAKNDCGTTSVAIHEVGHALTSILLGEKPFERITTIARGDAAGYVKLNSENSLFTKKQMLDNIKISLAGRIAEEIFYGEEQISTGASADIRMATRMARNMITRFGMSKEFGMMALVEGKNSYLGVSEAYTCSDAYREKVDAEINRLLESLLQQTRELLIPQKDNIEKLARRVFDEETMSGDRFVELCRELGILNKNE